MTCDGAIAPSLALTGYALPDLNVLSAEEAGGAAKASFQKAITWCTADAAGPGLGLLRAALLDLASVLIAEKAVPGALACLQAAATAGACLNALLTAPQDLGVVNTADVPAWISTSLQGECIVASACQLSSMHVSSAVLHVQLSFGFLAVKAVFCVTTPPEITEAASDRFLVSLSYAWSVQAH